MAITLTESAVKRVKGYLAQRGKGEGLRLGVRKTGCSGWAYVVDLTDEIKTDDVVFDNHGVKVVVDPESLAFLDGTEVDFRREGLGEAFKFHNPNVKDQCGCGESFNV
ncbi:MAG: iron-sulfur cluster assembly protein IscA [Gammaproteobacteria bacterium]